MAGLLSRLSRPVDDWSWPVTSLVTILCTHVTFFVADQQSGGTAEHEPVGAQGRETACTKVCICLTLRFVATNGTLCKRDRALQGSDRGLRNMRDTLMQAQ